MSLELSQHIAARLGAPRAHVLAFEEVESSGLGFWEIGGKRLPSIRHEAHIFGARTKHAFDETHPMISSLQWNPDLAAKTWAGAWAQHREAAALNDDAAKESASWGKYQVMGFNWRRLGYSNVDQFVDTMATEEGQAEAFARYIEADRILHRAIVRGDWQIVEDRYNGGGYGGAYARKMKAAAARYGGDGVAAQADEPIGPRMLVKGDQGDDVADLQRALQLAAQAAGPEAAAWDPGFADGQFGPRTEAAVRAFQAAQGLTVDGKAGPMTKAWLGLTK